MNTAQHESELTGISGSDQLGMSRKAVRLVVAVLLLANLIFSACTTSIFRTIRIQNPIDPEQLPGNYVLENFDIGERLVLREDATYEWTQIVVQSEDIGWYSHTGNWEIKGANIVLTPKERIPDSFKSSLRYVMLKIEGENVLVQKDSLRYVDSLKKDRFTYIKIVTPQGGKVGGQHERDQPEVDGLSAGKTGDP